MLGISQWILSGDPTYKLAWSGIAFVVAMTLCLYVGRVIGLIVGAIALWWLGWLITASFANFIRDEHDAVVVTILWPPGVSAILMGTLWAIVVLGIAVWIYAALQRNSPEH